MHTFDIPVFISMCVLSAPVGAVLLFVRDRIRGY